MIKTIPNTSTLPVKLGADGKLIKADNSEIDLTEQVVMISKPTITSIADGATEVLPGGTLDCSPLVPKGNFIGTLTGVEYKVFSDTELATVISNVTIATTIPSLQLEGLNPLTQYWIQVRYISGNITSPWSDAISFTTIDDGVNTPTIMVEGAPDNVMDTPTLTGSTFSTIVGNEVHESTDWRVIKTSDNSIVWESLNNTTNLTAIKVPKDLLETSTEYLFEVRYNASNIGSSNWGTLTLTTKDQFTFTYGVKWNQNTDTYVRTINGVEVSTTDYPVGQSSWDMENKVDDPNSNLIIFSTIQRKLKRCVLNSDGTVKYYLDPNDSTKKADGTAATIDGTDGNVMVEIPKFWFKYTYDDSDLNNVTHHWELADTPTTGFEVDKAFFRKRGGSAVTEVDYRYIGAYQGKVNSNDKLISGSGTSCTCNLTRDEFRTYARNNGTGWSQLDYYLMTTVQKLLLVEYASFNSQDVIGMGRTQLSSGSWEAGSYKAYNGQSNSVGNGTGVYNYAGDADDADADNAYSSYRGIENFWGNAYTNIDGINILADYQWYVCQDESNFADDTDSGYTKIADACQDSGYPTALVNSGDGFVPSSTTDGATDKGLADYYSRASGNRIFLLGKSVQYGLSAGAFAMEVDDTSSDKYQSVGGVVAY